MKSKAVRNSCLNRLQFLSRLALGFTALVLPMLALGQAAVVQKNSNPAVIVQTNSVAVAFPNAQTAGNLNVVVVGWNDTSSTIGSVSDSNGNTYELAAGTMSSPLATPGVSQAIYYAKNIKAGANTVTVTFNQSTAAQSVRIVEYSGLDLTNPLDTSVGASGNSVPADSGAVTTNSANDLLFGAGGITTGFTGPGTGFTEQLLNGFGDIIEDQSVAVAGSYNATAAFTSGVWVMQMVAFRLAGQTPPTFAAPAITSLSAASSPEAGGVPLTITGTNFEPGATVLFSNGTTTASGVNCNVTAATTIACLTPSFPVGAATITVTNVDGQASPTSAFSFTASTPFATAGSPGMNPSTGTTNGGTIVTIAGSDFAAGAKVTVGGVPAYNVSVANNNTIFASVPAGPVGAAPVVVTNPSNTPGGVFDYNYATVVGMSFVQANSAQPTSPATTATVNYTLAQTVGNLNVVIVGWADTTAAVQSVVDSAGNTYTLAFPATVGTGLSQAIYYAKNIVAATAGSNTVTVTFSVPALFPDVRILEYSGLDTVAPLETGGGDSGTSTAMDSGPITTINPSDLIIGASIGGTVAEPGKNFATVAITPAGAGVVHRINQPAGVVDATATLGTSTNWVMQAVAFGKGSAPDFVMSVTPPTASAIPGASATYTVSVTGFNGFNGAVTLTCPAGLPADAGCSFVPPSVTAGVAAVTSTLTITTSLATPLGMSTVTVNGTSGILSHDTSVGLTVIPAPDFTIAGTLLTPASVAAGGSATSTITIAALNGFNSAVNLTCGVAGASAPVPTCGFVPNSVAGGAGTSALTVSTSGTPVGTYTVTVTGATGPLNHATVLTLTVTAGPDFTIAGTALAPASVSPGASATSTITIAPQNSFNSAVNLTCTVTPAGARIPTCSFNPASVAGGSGTSMLTVSTTAATTASLTPHSRGAFYAMWLPIGGLALLGAGFSSRKRRLLCFLLGCMMFSGLVFMAACGGSSSSGGGGGTPGTPAGTYTVTVTGTSGALTHPVSLSLQVN